jgi:glycosyltransferase involved in cell wall biosynthesis
MTPTSARHSAARAEKATSAATLPFISVVVPVRNEERFLESTLQQLLSQDYPRSRFEILVADGRSTDGTRAIVQRQQALYPNLYLLDNPSMLASAGRNVAIQAARGDLILIIDGHCELDGRAHLQALAEAFADSGAPCVGRPQPLDVASATPLQRAIAAARASRLGHNPSSFIYSDTPQFVRPQSVAIAYRREVFAEVGLFDESFDACEDVEFNHRVDRAGLPCYFTPRVRVRYQPRETLGGLFRQLQRYGQGRVRLWRKHPDTFSLACFVPAAFLGGVVAGPWFALISGWLGTAYEAVLAIYIAALLVGSLMLAWRGRDLRLLPWLPLTFAAIHFGAGVGIWQELLGSWRPRRRVVGVPTLALNRASPGKVRKAA